MSARAPQRRAQAKAQPRAMWSTSFGSRAPSGDPARPSRRPARRRSRDVVGRAQRDRYAADADARGSGARCEPPSSRRAAHGQPAARKSTLRDRARRAGRSPPGSRWSPAVALRGERSSPGRFGRGGRARRRRRSRSRASRRARTCSSTAAPAACKTPAVLNGPGGGRAPCRSASTRPGTSRSPQQVDARVEGKSRTLSFVLRAAQRQRCGWSACRGARPSTWTIGAVDAEQAARRVAPGSHRLRVEAADGVVFSKTIEVSGGRRAGRRRRTAIGGKQ